MHRAIRFAAVVASSVLALTLVVAPSQAANTAGEVSEYALGFPGERAIGIAADLTDNVWFTMPTMTKIGKVTPDGQITYYDQGLTVGGVWQIAPSPDGSMWFTEFLGDKVGKISPDGEITEFDLQTGDGPWGITPGPDNAMWVTLASVGAIAKVAADGTITRYTDGGIQPGLRDITVSEGGDLWFSQYQQNKIGRLTAQGAYTGYALPNGAGPTGITSGTDGKIWFTESGLNQVGKIDPGNGNVTEYAAGVSTPQDIAGAADGNMWFTSENTNAVSRITTSGSVTTYSGVSHGTYGITPSASGNMWFTVAGTGNAVGTITTGVDPAVSNAGLTGSGEVGTAMTCSAAQWATQPVQSGYLWQLDGQDIPNQTSDTYTVTKAAVGKQITCVQTATFVGVWAISRSVSNAIEAVPTTPGAPSNVQVVPGDQSATVSWSAPADDGGAPVTSYLVTASPGNATCSTNGALTCEVQGLTNGVPYTFTVAARNSAGEGPSVESVEVTPKAPQAITFTSKAPRRPQPRVDTYTVKAVGGGSGNPVLFATTTAATCSVSGSTVSFLAPGKCVITADQAGDAAYLPAPQATQTVTVARVTQVPAKPLNLPKTLQNPGLTRVVKVPVMTNAGQKARVSITAHNRRTSVSGETRPFRVIRKAGYLWVQLSGEQALAVTVSVRAPAVPGYTPMLKRKVYRTSAVS